MGPRQLAAYLFLAVIWGLSFLVLVKAVAAFGWAGAVTFRSFIAGLTLLAVARLTGRTLDFRGGWPAFAIIGATTVAGQLVGLSFATPLVGTAMSAILVATIPLFSMVVGRLSGIERLTPQSAAGLVLGFAGIVLLVGFPAAPITPTFILGCAGVLFASLSSAIGSCYASTRLQTSGSWAVTAGAFLWGGLFTLPLLALVPVPGTPDIVDFGYLLILGGGMSALAYVVYFSLVGEIGPTRAVSVEFVVTLVAVAIGAIFLDERLSLMQLVGAAIVLLGCALVLGLFRPRPAV